VRLRSRQEALCQARAPPSSRLGSASEKVLRERRGDSQLAGPRPVRGEIGFVELVTWERRWPNLASMGRKVSTMSARNPIGRLEAYGLRAKTDIGDLLDCEVSISMLPDDDACAKSCSVAEILTRRSSAGRMPARSLCRCGRLEGGCSVLASAHARNGQG